jgi:hypothetical protein
MGIMKLLGTSFSTILNGGNPTADRTITFPDASGESLLQGRALTLMTAVTASGTSVDFTGIPSWAKRITVMFNGLSLSGVDNMLIQFGSTSGIENTGYVCSTAITSSIVATTFTTTGIYMGLNAAARALQGELVVNKLSGLSNSLVYMGSFNDGVANAQTVSGSKTLSNVINTIRIKPNGTDTFDAGTINVMYEG